MRANMSKDVQNLRFMETSFGKENHPLQRTVFFSFRGAGDFVSYLNPKEIVVWLLFCGLVDFISYYANPKKGTYLWSYG